MFWTKIRLPLHIVGRKIKIQQLKQRRRYTCTDYFVTTPIFYVNSVPHIGHLYTALLADSVARWHELKGGTVTFTTGTDEHGLKIQQAAEKAGLSPKVHCDQISKCFEDLFQLTDIKYTDFIRTTEDRHKDVVHQVWEILKKNGYIYKGCYEGWYSISDEAFLSDMDVMEIQDNQGNKIMIAKESQQPVVWTKEDNYMFKLTAFKEGLSSWLDNQVIKPETFEGMVRHWVNHLEDISISRPRDRLSWGIPVPDDETQTIYVWLDALVNYLTVSEYPEPSCEWPPDCHVIGKDILRFHAVYWPAFLLAAELPLPKRIQCHSHFLVDHHKMSKSRGNVVDPFDRVDRYTSDGLRYFLLKTGTPHMDCSYNDSKAVETLNTELADHLGNLLNRCTSKKIIQGFGFVFPALNPEMLETKFTDEDIKMYRSLQKLPDLMDELYCDYQIYKVIELSHAYFKWANKLLTNNKPWELAKSVENTQHLRCLIHMVMETLRVNGILLQPVIPNLMKSVLDRLGVPEDERMIKDIYFGASQISDVHLGEPHGALFPKLTDDSANRLVSKMK